jgi:hypothetical protein
MLKSPIVLSYIFFGVPMLMYLGQSGFVYLAQGRYGMALCLAGYAIGNVGLIMDAHGI